MRGYMLGVGLMMAGIGAWSAATAAQSAGAPVIDVYKSPT